MANKWMIGVLSATGKIVPKGGKFSSPQLGLLFRHFSANLESQAAATGNAGVKNIEMPILKDLREMPGPRVLPGVGTEWVYYPLGPYTSIDNYHIAKIEMREKYGPIYKEKLGGHWVVNTSNIKDIEIMIWNEGQYPQRTANQATTYYRRSCPEIYKNLGLLNSSGEEWYIHRNMLNKTILKSNNMNIMVPSVSETADAWVSYIKRNRTPNSAIPDIQMTLKRFGLDAVSSTMFGERIGTLDETPSQHAEEYFYTAINLTEAEHEFTLKTKWHLWRYFPTPTWKKMVASESGLLRIFGELLQKYEKGQGSTMPENCIMQKLLQQKDVHEQDIKVAGCDLLNASLETISAFLTRVLHRLGQEPRVQNNLWKELDAALGDPTQRLTWKALNDVPYLKATGKEAYRILSIIPSLLRVTPKTLNLQGYEIPAYTPILAQTYAECLREENFTRPLEFLPERFLNPKDLSKEQLEYYESQVGDLDALHQETRASRRLYQIFSTGARACVGRRLAESEIYVFLAKVILNFKVESHGELGLNSLKCMPFMSPKNKVSIVLQDR